MTKPITRALGAAIFATLSLGLAGPGVAHEYKAGDLEILHPWAKAAPAGAKVIGGYVVVKNHGATPDRLIGVSGEIAGKAEIHEMGVDANGVMTMRMLPNGVEAPAGGQAELKPGGFHIMFLNLNRVPAVGEKFKGSLTFEKAGKVDVEFSVDKGKADAAPDAHGGHDAHQGHGG